MSSADRQARPARQPTFAELYVPKLVTVLREGYGLSDFRADVLSGLTVAIVALPLSMAIAIASGVTQGRMFIPNSPNFMRRSLPRSAAPCRIEYPLHSRRRQSAPHPHSHCAHGSNLTLSR